MCFVLNVVLLAIRAHQSGFLTSFVIMTQGAIEVMIKFLHDLKQQLRQSHHICSGVFVFISHDV